MVNQSPCVNTTEENPLVQGGLEVLCQVTVSMPGCVVNHVLLTLSLLKLIKDEFCCCSGNHSKVSKIYNGG